MSNVIRIGRSGRPAIRTQQINMRVAPSFLDSMRDAQDLLEKVTGERWSQADILEHLLTNYLEIMAHAVSRHTDEPEAQDAEPTFADLV